MYKKITTAVYSYVYWKLILVHVHNSRKLSHREAFCLNLIALCLLIQTTKHISSKLIFPHRLSYIRLEGCIFQYHVYFDNCLLFCQ